MKTTNKPMAVAMMAIAMATALDFNDKMALRIADKMNIDESTAFELAGELKMAKAAAEKDMENEFSDYTYKDLEYLYDDLEEELFSCNNRKRELEIGNLLDSIEAAMIKRGTGNGNFRA